MKAGRGPALLVAAQVGEGTEVGFQMLLAILWGDAGGGGDGAEKLEQIALARGPDGAQTA